MKSRDDIRFELETNRRLGIPHRRFLAAREYVRQRLLPSRRDDEATKTLRRFLEERRKCRGTADRLRLRRTYPDLAMAFDLRRGRLSHLAPWVEAYSLGGLDGDAVGSRFGIPGRAVAWFQAAFFDVEDLVAYPGRILFEVIGIVDERGRPSWNFHKLCKSIGFLLKADALDQLLGIRNGSAPKIAPQAWLTLQAHAIAQLQQFLATAALDPDNAKQTPAILKLAQRSGTSEQEDALSVMGTHMRALLDEIPWAVGDDGATMLAGTKLGSCDETAVELRDEEVQRLAAGENLPELDEFVNLEIPPPRSKNPVSESGSGDSPLEALSKGHRR